MSKYFLLRDRKRKNAQSKISRFFVGPAGQIYEADFFFNSKGAKNGFYLPKLLNLK